MIKIKNILNKWFSKKPNKKPKLLGYENCELKVIKGYGYTVKILVPKGYNNPEIDFLKEWLENEEAKYEFGLYNNILYAPDNAKLLDNYLRFSFDLLQGIRATKPYIGDIDTYEKYINLFEIKVPGFKKYTKND